LLFLSQSPGQEEGNVPFVEDSGFGKYSPNPKVIADTISKWLANPEMMASMKSAALAAARPSATLDIAKDLAQIIFASKEQQLRNQKATVASSKP
jgi:1,2-diacylglycerol 3-beta-galactosyltransferase